MPGGVGECARLLAADRHPGGRVEVVLEEVARGAVVHDLRAQFGGGVLPYERMLLLEIECQPWLGDEHVVEI